MRIGMIGVGRIGPCTPGRCIPCRGGELTVVDTDAGRARRVACGNRRCPGGQDRSSTSTGRAVGAAAGPGSLPRARPCVDDMRPRQPRRTTTRFFGPVLSVVRVGTCADTGTALWPQRPPAPYAGRRPDICTPSTGAVVPSAPNRAPSCRRCRGRRYRPLPPGRRYVGPISATRYKAPATTSGWSCSARGSASRWAATTASASLRRAGGDLAGRHYANFLSGSGPPTLPNWRRSSSGERTFRVLLPAEAMVTFYVADL